MGYIGFIQDGKRLIHAKGECGYSDLRQPWGIILDGGACYFEAFFDPSTGELGIGFNGVA